MPAIVLNFMSVDEVVVESEAENGGNMHNNGF